jgi:mRNA-degrading endonuclease RelE of RelBE toxin-antitoxin system
MQQDPFPGDVVQLRGSAMGYRRRIGSYRILFTLQMRERRVNVTDIARRTSTTY